MLAKGLERCLGGESSICSVVSACNFNTEEAETRGTPWDLLAGQFGQMGVLQVQSENLS